MGDGSLEVFFAGGPWLVGEFPQSLGGADDETLHPQLIASPVDPVAPHRIAITYFGEEVVVQLMLVPGKKLGVNLLVLRLAAHVSNDVQDWKVEIPDLLELFICHD